MHKYSACSRFLEVFLITFSLASNTGFCDCIAYTGENFLPIVKGKRLKSFFYLEKETIVQCINYYTLFSKFLSITKIM